MRKYLYRIHDVWLTCFAKSKEEVKTLMGEDVEEILTLRQAQKRAEQGDKELSDYLQMSYLCDLMCP